MRCIIALTRLNIFTLISWLCHVSLNFTDRYNLKIIRNKSFIWLLFDVLKNSTNISNEKFPERFHCKINGLIVIRLFRRIRRVFFVKELSLSEEVNCFDLIFNDTRRRVTRDSLLSEPNWKQREMRTKTSLSNI